MHGLKVWLRHYFGFTTRESNGFIVLASILLFVLIFPSLYDLYQPEKEPIVASIEILKADSILPKLSVSSKIYKTPQLFEFDPNLASEQDFLKLGLPSFLAKRIINYRNKAGRFRKKEEFARIYGLQEETYNKLEPFIHLPEQTLEKPKWEKKEWERPVSKTLISIEINQADTGSLKSVNGIGNVLANRILKYRNSLGGFTTQDQLYEVYGLDSLVAEKVFKSFKITSTGVKKLKINHLSLDSLAKHPYIKRKSAKILVNYRLHHKIESVDDVRNSRAIEPDLLNKLIPYLEF
ncbi:MAG: helix-hairpin-helix domain-containing protein [Opitutaceae bacterium]|nr:helix-hairpin-helix domain-containing protein [Cytophagales bacterium]